MQRHQPAFVYDLDQTNNAVGSINDLMEVLADGRDGYRTAAENVENQELAKLFRDYAEQRDRFGTELLNMATDMGATPETDGSILAEAHQGWINLKAAVTDGNAKAILEEVERGEDKAKETYEDVLERDLPSSLNDKIVEQYKLVKRAHDYIRNLRDSQ